MPPSVTAPPPSRKATHETPSMPVSAPKGHHTAKEAPKPVVKETPKPVVMETPKPVIKETPKPTTKPVSRVPVSRGISPRNVETKPEEGDFMSRLLSTRRASGVMPSDSFVGKELTSHS